MTDLDAAWIDLAEEIRPNGPWMDIDEAINKHRPIIEAAAHDDAYRQGREDAKRWAAERVRAISMPPSDRTDYFEGAVDMRVYVLAILTEPS